MRTHTSPGPGPAPSASAAEPIRVVLPGKCYRYKQITARSEHQFYQMEGLVVGKGIRMTDLIGTLKEFARQMYGSQRQLRPPAATPSPSRASRPTWTASCAAARGAACPVHRWLEIAGAGMVHPVVLRNGGYNPDIYSGFAFGMGVERPTMLKNRISDIRYFYGNDLRFLGQF